ncbi:MAG: YitT family protein [Candidatus Phytoplasma stylosanthis]|uniref:YitT family protein n=1 Tax=Candidatus Phytoplasma stylosanthis TaxID=2798314 RepID=UPI002939E8A5|nr:YitT family protein [Candidatus Phytoplasma stylosanthis]MDV3170818.1 YitT family protein [Candidatus Phytoplasma stylosanthis]MDV3174168.1 YitT family protein [Candidatus Phytoplasma stylosanthis]MDV3202541.1 YitT family protein [Candidatus Phytoplasma stylosanthis]
MKNSKKVFIIFLFFLFIAFVCISLDFPFNIHDKTQENLKIGFSILTLIFSIYFFVLPEKFIIGGLESNLIFLDKIFFYDKKKKEQKYFFSQNSVIVFFRIFILLFSFLMFLFGFLELQILLSSLLFSFIFAIIIRIFRFYKIKQNFIIMLFPRFIKKNIFYKFFLSSLITGLIVGISSGFLLKSRFATGGTDVIFLFIPKIFSSIELPIMFLIFDGSTILFSFLIDLNRNQNQNKKKILIKYFFSIFIFLTAISVINYMKK